MLMHLYKRKFKPNHIVLRVKCIGSIEKGVFNSHLGSHPDPCYIQNSVIMNHVIKRFRCTSKNIVLWNNSELSEKLPSLRLFLKKKHKSKQL